MILDADALLKLVSAALAPDEGLVSVPKTEVEVS
jgi:hypothetical protein